MTDKSLASVIDEEENFNFRPYAFLPIGIHRVQISKEVISEIVLAPQSSVLVKDQFFLAS